ncbi:hypothetical protein B0E33_09895 [Roseibium algicola]|uniref:Uncharacterized protein n=1 Tax=Roseibium algicola TaxID=2857014 RepID=A0ABM6I0K1_9HYPH|nr:hypothetical protein [Roseibium aggregatum]AQQ03862.1 hypothetical protein B0E33_09895 [Roseibium aggregatum]
MFDRTASTNWHVTATPHVTFTALRVLDELLRDVGTPSHRQVLPAETRQSVTRLMTRLILSHIDGERVVQREGQDHDA